MQPRLTVGMPCHNDFDGVYFTVQALSIYHPEVMAEAEIVVIDNAPETQQGAYTRDFISNWVRNGRYFPYTDVIGPAGAKNRVFAEARGEYVVCLDAHVLLAPGSLSMLLAYYGEHPTTCDLLQGPMVQDDLRSVCTHMDPVWRGEMYGIWASDPGLLSEEAGRSPREIGMHGLGLFTCRRESWLGFNPKFAGFGGEEGYIHQKYRNSGHTTRLLPYMKWVHRFPRTHPIQFPCTKYHKIRNYLIGWAEVGLPIAPLLEHFRPLTPREELESAIRDSGVPAELLATDYIST